MSYPSDDDPDAQILNAERMRMFAELGADVNSRCAAFVKYGRLLMDRCKLIREGKIYSNECMLLLTPMNDAWMGMNSQDKKRGQELREKMMTPALAVAAELVRG